ncbi:hypothetical protein [Methylomonas methanica]|uniref:Helix-turn-helix domain-containing protein n=1 Tax=Methylomonas methanica (strain DSM 25384 / MC09) TaxID=857087 RepID=G0A220_METMM|nr:hypothetical protein [Methylomonas methanica]AEG02563.1 hypothetical protein Metme_4212 [Methylomonas methanica MC09]
MEQNQSNVNVTIPIQTFVPLMTQKQFAELSGLSRDAVKAQVINGYWPSVKVGKYRMINLISLVDQLKVAESEIVGG